MIEEEHTTTNTTNSNTNDSNAAAAGGSSSINTADSSVPIDLNLDKERSSDAMIIVDAGFSFVHVFCFHKGRAIQPAVRVMNTYDTSILKYTQRNCNSTVFVVDCNRTSVVCLIYSIALTASNHQIATTMCYQCTIYTMHDMNRQYD
jgi:hypothetical protein